jgi:hypothetical protein
VILAGIILTAGYLVLGVVGIAAIVRAIAEAVAGAKPRRAPRALPVARLTWSARRRLRRNRADLRAALGRGR